MDKFEKLKSTLIEAQETQDLPDYISELVEEIINLRNEFESSMNEIDNLTEKIQLYDTYGQTGYLGMGVDSAILEKTLKRMLRRTKR
jgi:hypothetical protein